MELQNILPLFDKFVAWATPKKVIMLGATAIVTLACYTFFENRNIILDLVLANRQEIYSAPEEFRFSVTADMQDRATQMVLRSKLLNFISISNSNLRVNTRDVVWWFSDDPGITREITNTLAARGTASPIFSTDTSNNEQFTNLLNGEFTCTPFINTIDGKINFSLATRITSICRVSLPPYYGSFSGFVTIGFETQPDDISMAEIRASLLQLSTEIFFKSIAPRVR